MNRNLIRMIENPARRMQRLGFLKYLIARSSQSVTSSMQALGSDLLRTVTKKVTVPLTPELLGYLNVTFKGQPSKPVPRRVETAPEQPAGDVVTVELQDVYLSSSSLESRRGRLVSTDWRNYPYLALGLGLLRPESFSLLVRGQVLLKLVRSAELRAFSEYLPDTNPLMLSTVQRLFFLFTFVERDQHVLIPLYRALLNRTGDFTDWEAGDLLPEILRELHRHLRSPVRSGADTLRLQRLLDNAKTIEQWRGKPYKGTGARDAAATLRLEPFVDLGLLSKADPFAYRYSLSPAGQHLVSGLTNSEGNSDWLDKYFFGRAVEAYGLGVPHLSDSETMLDAIYESLRTLASPVGYAPIREVLLYAAISVVDAGKGYFEMAEGLDNLQKAQRQHPDLVRFNVDRWGNVTFVKFTRSPDTTKTR